MLEPKSNEAQKGEAEKLPLPGIAKTFSIPLKFHLCTLYTLSLSTFNRKRFLKPGTSGDNARLDGTEAPETAETTSSPGQSVSFGFHSVSCGKLSTQVLGLLINVLGSQKSQQMCRISKQSFPLSDLNSIQFSEKYIYCIDCRTLDEFMCVQDNEHCSFHMSTFF